MRELISSNELQGKYVNLRLATEEDAEFTLNLRRDRSHFFDTKIENDLEKQKAFIRKCLDAEDEYFFIIENKVQEPLGTVSIYNIKEKDVTSGRWATKKNVSILEFLEEEYLFNNYIFNILNKENIFFDVYKFNKSVIKYNLAEGASIIKEDSEKIYFVKNINVFKKRKRF